MRELALHVLDIAENSIRACATCISITVEEMTEDNWLFIKIEDNGSGIDEALLKNITNPFTTTRTLRRVGLGIPFMSQMCKECGGTLTIQSEIGKGTTLEAKMIHNHIDRLPLGNMAETLITLIMAKPDVRFIYTYRYNNKEFTMDTEQIQQLLEDVPINDLEILHWLKAYIASGENEVK